MASTQSILERYLAILRRLKKSPASFEEISGSLDREFGFRNLELSFSKRTFKRDREDLEASFGVEIMFDQKSGKYFLHDDDSLDMKGRAFDAFHIASVIQTSVKLSRSVFPESRRPVGSENFYGIVYAIENKKIVRFKYYKIEDDITTDRRVIPIGLKESLGYWYLVGKDLKDNHIKVFGTDRLSDLEFDGRFNPDEIDFDVEKYFARSFGVIVPRDAVPVKVILEFDWNQGQYIIRFPLHSSQQIVSENDHHVIIELDLYVTYDFEQKLLSFGPDVKVLQPESLAKTIREYHLRSASRY